MAYHLDTYDNAIVMDGVEQGIAESPFSGISDIRNANITSIPGESSVNFATTSVAFASSSGSVVSADSGTEIITLSGVTTALVSGMAVVFTGGSLPGNIVAGTPYLITVLSATTIKIHSTYVLYLAGTAFNISSTGTGTFATVDMGKPNQRWFDSTTGSRFVIDTNGRAWIISSTTAIYLLNSTLANASGNGIAYYRGYLFVFRNALIDYMVWATGVWTYAWQTMNTAGGTGNPHYAHLGQDDVIYYCDGQYLGSFFQKPNGPPQTIVFDPTSSATYVWNQQALALPSNDTANCLSELGIKLLVGGHLNAIYPWDRTSTSFTYPILLAESFISRMVTVNTSTYILAGQRGRIYITNGSQATLYKKVPDHISGIVEPAYTWGDLAAGRNQLYFGVSAKNNNGSGTVINEYGGVWAVDLDSTAIRLANKLSYGTYAGLATVLLPPAIAVSGTPPLPSAQTGGGLTVGWDSGVSTYGVDVSSGTPYTGSQTAIDYDLIPIGTYNTPKDMTQVEYKLTRPLVTGESIVIKCRLLFDITDQSSGAGQYTTILTDSTAGNYSSTGSVNFKNAQWVQFQAVLNSTASSPSYVRLRQIRILGVTNNIAT